VGFTNALKQLTKDDSYLMVHLHRNPPRGSSNNKLAGEWECIVAGWDNTWFVWINVNVFPVYCGI
jgi:hypothetical protein